MVQSCNGSATVGHACCRASGVCVPFHCGFIGRQDAMADLEGSVGSGERARGKNVEVVQCWLI